MELFELTRSLIDIPSVSGEEGAVGRFLADYLEGLGYGVELQGVADDRANVIAVAGERPRVFLSTHMDTVPPFIRSWEDDEYIYGRGACDAKGIIAAQITAAERLRANSVQDIGLLFTVDEEMSSLGARFANAHPIAEHCKFLINGEPTDNLLAIGSKGSLRLRVKTTGKAAHSAYPEQGKSAIEGLLNLLEKIRKIDWPTSDFFGETTCNIGVIHGGTRPNVIPAEAQADLQIRLVTESALVKSILEEVVGDAGTIEYLSAAEPVRMHAVEGVEQTVVRFTTDIPYLKKWGTPMLLGPGSILVAHTEDERISKKELKDAERLYMKLVEMVGC
jgi:acetylornithine deacetylase